MAAPAGSAAQPAGQAFQVAGFSFQIAGSVVQPAGHGIAVPGKVIAKPGRPVQIRSGAAAEPGKTAQVPGEVGPETGRTVPVCGQTVAEAKRTTRIPDQDAPEGNADARPCGTPAAEAGAALRARTARPAATPGPQVERSSPARAALHPFSGAEPRIRAAAPSPPLQSSCSPEHAMDAPAVFISYSHKDEAWKDRLVRQLRVLELEGAYVLWDDRKIAAGDGWRAEIGAALERARAAVLLISADFLISDPPRSG